MRKITLLFVMLMFNLMAFAQFAPYCGPMTFTNNVEPITRVTFAGIDNSSSATVGPNNGTTIIAHENYIALPGGNVTAGSAYPISLKGNTDGDYPTRLRVFMDWNHDNDFNDSGETYDIGTIQNSTGVDAIVLTGSISVPGTALGGNTRMRVTKKWNVFSDSCNTIGTGFGQAEDYTLNVTAVAACLSGFNFPDELFTPDTCDGFTENTVSEESYAGDYFEVAVTAGQTYRFLSSVATDYYTISADGDVTAAASGIQPLIWTPTVTGTVFVHINTDSGCGEEEEPRTTSIICGDLCLDGGVWPFTNYTPDTCDGVTVNLVTDEGYAGEYSLIDVFSSNTYTFSSSVATDYITITSEDGATPYAVGTGSATYTPAADGTLRFYTHLDAACGAEEVPRERNIVCTSALTVPGCPTNPTPADGDTTVTAFGDIIIAWDAPTTGDPATSYDVYFGASEATLAYAGTVPNNDPVNVGSLDAYSTTVYWQVIAVNAAGESVGCDVWSFTTEDQPTDTLDGANLQSPAVASVQQGSSVAVYGRAYEDNLTNTTTGQAPGILVWVGINDEDTDPDTWTYWVPATFNAETDSNDNDEYVANIGNNLVPGTYYYATRFTLNGGPYVYGGINASLPNEGDFWDGATYGSGVLTVTTAPVPVNDDCSGAILLTAGSDFAVNDVTGTNIGATDSAEPDPACSSYLGGDVWFKVVVPASGTLTIETQTDNDSVTDTGLEIFEGTCPGGLTSIDCDDDGGIDTYSLLELDSLTPGDTIYLRLFAYDNAEFGTFKISAYDASLATDQFNTNHFTYYPNPVKDVLNLSYDQTISSVEVFNLLGQKVSSTKFNANEAQVNMSNLSDGAYMVKVTSNNQVKTIKVIKQ